MMDKPTLLPIPNATDFAVLRDAYFAAKKPLFLNDHDLKLNKSFSQSLNGALVPFEIRQTEHGRGIVTLQDISQGDVVWDDQFYGRFFSEQQWDSFLDRLEPRLQADVMLWAWMSKDDDQDDDDNYYVGLDLEESSLMNHGGTPIDTSEESLKEVRPNNLHLQEGDSVSFLIATRDILAGEELLCDYTEFHDPNHDIVWF